jgi:dienelactone hydrolase
MQTVVVPHDLASQIFTVGVRIRLDHGCEQPRRTGAVQPNGHIAGAARFCLHSRMATPTSASYRERVRRVGIMTRQWLANVVLLMVLATGAHAQDDGFNPALAPDAPLNEKVLNLPGDPTRPVTLEVTLFTPPGLGPFPLAVLNHGATGASINNRGHRYRYTYSAYYFLSRGYAVALPMARGFADSGGDLVHDGCALDRVGLANAQDVRAVIDALGRQPGIDRSRVVVAGQSFGGWTSLALGTMEVPGVHGLIGFSPAVRASDCREQDQAMVAGAATFGSRAKLPSLWFYGDNDTLMPVSTWRAVFDAYARAGGRGELVPVGRFLQDSHQMLSFPESLPLWTPRVDAFLTRIGLPSAETHPEYLPIPTPPASRFAAATDVAAVPSLNDKGRDAYRTFLTQSFPRAFAVGPGGTFSDAHGGFDPLARSLLACRKVGITCRPYAIDSDVVWPVGSAAPDTYARTVPAGSTATLNFAFAVNPDCSSRGLSKLWVSQPPAHGTSAILTRDGHPRFPPGHPFAACNTVRVPGVAVTYTPAPGFSGSDTMTFEETDLDGGHHVFRMALTVQ